MVKGCAVVIGVSKTGDLESLQSPIPGAEAVADFLRRNSYDVELLTDRLAPVTTDAVKAAVKSFTDRQSIAGYQLFVVYFTGHGYWKNEGDIWLLSDAPTDAGAAINVRETADCAQDCGIDTVVLISDACRSTPKGKTAERVRGTPVIPNLPGLPGRHAKIDKLMGSREGTPAFETDVDGSGVESVFTHCILKAFRSPDTNMILSVTEEGQTFGVVPNRRLEKFICREVRDKLSTVNIGLNQEPVIDIVSDELVYMGRVGTAALVEPQSDWEYPPLADVGLSPAAVVAAQTIELRVDESGVLELPGSYPNAVTAIALSPTLIRHAFNVSLSAASDGPIPIDPEQVSLNHAGSVEVHAPQSVSDFLNGVAENIANGGLGDAAKSVTHFESGTGFTLTGSFIRDALLTGVGARNSQIEILDRGDTGGMGVIRVWLKGCTSATLLLVLDDGRSIPLAVLDGYIGHILVVDQQVRAVSYVPVDNLEFHPRYSPRWQTYVSNRERLERLRAVAAAAIAGNRFSFGDAVRAGQMAEVFRNIKAVDPMLGLYAAYAYLEAGDREQITSVGRFMTNDLDTLLFDVALLSKSRVPNTEKFSEIVVPFCPILTQGWNYLRSRYVNLPSILSDAQDSLVPGPLTVFESVYTSNIVTAIRSGELSEK